MSIERLETPQAAQAWAAAQHAAGKSLGLIPTMGALHEGHLELVQRAVAENDLACVSVFVNPLQFDKAHDLESYPRDLETDARLLQGVGCSMVFTGTLEGFFPGALAADQIQRVDPGPAATGLEGAFREGHFDGVATIVARLFELVLPERTYFGAKDFQQTLVAEHVARQLNGPQVVVCATSRDADGLARSSRNLLLPSERRADALSLSRALHAARARWQAGERGPEALRGAMLDVFKKHAIELEYAELRDPNAWNRELVGDVPGDVRALVAGRVGRVRLLDNMALGADA